MGIDTYKVRASRLIKHLSETFGLSLSSSQALTAVAAEEGIPRANWNLLAARALHEPSKNESELVLGCTGSGKSLYAKQAVAAAVAARRPVLIISRSGEYELFVQALGGGVTKIEEDGSLKSSKGISKVSLLTWDYYSSHKPQPLFTLKELGFDKPDLREIVVICDEIHGYEQEPWFLSLLGQVAANECSTIQLLSQYAPHSLAAAVTAKVGRLRVFRLHDLDARQLFDSETASVVVNLPVGQSIIREVALATAAEKLLELASAAASTITAILTNQNTKVFLKIASTSAESLAEAKKEDPQQSSHNG
ncbi:hypothetical protein [Ralstonia pseudosolanacearum]|uniref:hypothetical protein n=1 Tax=Ralstonia pseudosolanacearum TaxID=1310165 RepID=UPI003CF15929